MSAVEKFVVIPLSVLALVCLVAGIFHPGWTLIGVVLSIMSAVLYATYRADMWIVVVWTLVAVLSTIKLYFSLL